MLAICLTTTFSSKLDQWSNGAIWRFTVTAQGQASWKQTASNGNSVTMDPTDVNHILFTDRKTFDIIESTDGGATSTDISKDGAWYSTVCFERRATQQHADHAEREKKA